VWIEVWPISSCHLYVFSLRFVPFNSIFDSLLKAGQRYPLLLFGCQLLGFVENLWRKSYELVRKGKVQGVFPCLNAQNRIKFSFRLLMSPSCWNFHLFFIWLTFPFVVCHILYHNHISLVSQIHSASLNLVLNCVWILHCSFSNFKFHLRG